jgi:spore germination cell wall hydrolase CwlJ-like protein
MLFRSALAFSMLLLATCAPQSGAVRGSRAAIAAAAATTPGFTSQTWTPIAQMPMPTVEAINAAIDTGHAAEPFQVPPGRQAMMGNAVACLTDAVYYEARSESEDGQRAVAQVVLNRVRHPAFPRSVCGVVFQGSTRSTGCQFSFTCDGSMRRAREPGAWERARAIAEQALAGSVFAPVGLATHFHTTAIHPWWASSLTRAVTVGAHVFYRWPGQWGDPLAFRRPYLGAEGVIPSPTYTSAPIQTQGGSVQTVMGVTIHRGGDSRVSVQHGGETLEPTPRYASLGGRSGSSSAVRVHRGGGTGGGAGVTVHSGAPAALASADDGRQAPADSAATVTR